MTRRFTIFAAVGAVAIAAGTVLTAATAPAAVNPAGSSSALSATGFDFTRPEVVATGLEVPWGLTFLPDGSALVAERMSARILRLSPGATPQVVATVPGVVPRLESGLLGLAASPTFADDDLVYAYFTAATDNRIVRFRLSSPDTVEPILTGLIKAPVHDGGRIKFGPDGMLYAGVGDATDTANAQNEKVLNGKILRMQPDGSVPPDNPFPGSLVYTLGHRNVQGFAWDSQNRMYATEFGQATWDEVNLIQAGGNYGWPIVEGIGTPDPRFHNPLVQWRTSEASPSGAAIAGDTLYAAALAGKRLWTVPLDGKGGVGTPTAELQGVLGRLRTVELGPDGWLWVTTSNRDGRGSPAAQDDQVLRFPPLPTASPSVDPSSGPVDPSSGPVDPSSGPVDPSSGPVDPSSAPADPSSAPADPSSAPADPSSAPADPAGPAAGR